MSTPSMPEDPSTTNAVAFEPLKSPRADAIRSIPTKVTLYTSCLLAYVQVMSFGWAQVQLNYTRWHDPTECAARPIAANTCLVFPGLSDFDWTLIINAWVVGGMIMALGGGALSEGFGRRKMLIVDAIIMIVGALVQAFAPSMAVFIVGRFIAGMASGMATSIPNAYVNEITPPHLRSALGSIYQMGIAFGGIFAIAMQFIAGSSPNWQYTAAFPVVFGLIFIVFAPCAMVESPTWLLAHGRREDAEKEIARLFGEEGVATALLWMDQQAGPRTSSNPTDSNVSLSGVEGLEKSETLNVSFKDLFGPGCRTQTLVGFSLAIAMQFCGITAVMVYSSSIFNMAGLYDGRVGNMLINVVTLIPPFFSGWTTTRFGNKKTLLGGMVVMFFCTAVLTVALITTTAWLAVLAAAIHVASFALTIGPLTFIVATGLFPDNLRPFGAALCVFVDWLFELIVSVGYPYVAEALNDYGMTPFLVAIVLLVAYQIHFLPDTTGLTNAEIQLLFRKDAKESDEASSEP